MEPEKKSSGAMVGLVVVIIILILGGIYMWQTNKNTSPADEVPLQSDTVSAQESADLEALDQELNATNPEIDANVINSVQ